MRITQRGAKGSIAPISSVFNHETFNSRNAVTSPSLLSAIPEEYLNFEDDTNDSEEGTCSSID